MASARAPMIGVSCARARMNGWRISVAVAPLADVRRAAREGCSDSIDGADGHTHCAELMHGAQGTRGAERTRIKQHVLNTDDDGDSEEEDVE
eukprot:6181044-Pleurochrysis_carterae.AAC.2